MNNKMSKEEHLKMNRRTFLSTGMAISAFSIIPNHVFAAHKKGMVAPSDKICLLHIGCGTQGLSELRSLLKAPAVEIIGVADPNRESYNYIHWSKYGLRDDLRELMREPTWKENIKGIPGGRNIMKEVVEVYYRKNRPGYKGSIASAEDYRELLATMKDIDAVKIMSPDHLHAYQAVDCLKKGKHVIMHKPLGNKMKEAMKVVDTAKASTLSTHMMAYNAFGDGNMDQIKKWIDAGAIGELKEIHNWTNRPVWPQYPVIPSDKPAIPDGFNWDLWLGPAEMRDYHPQYTNATFRGWYEFGAGAIADMGYYSLWPVFDALQLDSATSVSTRFSRVIGLEDNVPTAIVNDYSYPMAAAYRFEVPYKNGSGKITLQWYDGGMKPQIPQDYKEDDLPIEGMMFVGDKGTIISGFLRKDPVILGENASHYSNIKGYPMAEHPRSALADGTERWLQKWIDGCRGKGKGPGSFEYAKEVNETFNLGAVSLMSGGQKLEYDPQTRVITNNEEANKLLSRKTRKGWEID
ncbi:Gfo/Idh/MocA family protein [Parabacteroides bouchesdurhonensis]|uniref:Gfo/Idh/MocA family protein n=1 Tax=Parabacteroides bouchesdurhonensis TaxID=1936995 RepID=UPI000E530CF3|nr:Gfo/Idh/MocA family oxidoreductase [Parabacteroides bouchesdurhonensis]RHJ95375.1 gfo/Idh/MocA family oxidoreductase [Bacteroides sp. AM07-16]